MKKLNPRENKALEHALNMYIDKTRQSLEIMENNSDTFPDEGIRYYKVEYKTAIQIRLDLLNDIANDLKHNQ